MSGEIERLVASINERPDLLHGDRTPAVEALVQHGVDALPHVLPLLEVEEDPTRMRAQRVLEGVTRAWVQERTRSPALAQGAVREWQRLWRENGSYDWRASAELRAAAARRWREWLANTAAEEDVSG